MADLFPDRIETDRLLLEALRTDTVDPLTYCEHVSAESADEVTTHLPWNPHDHPRESLDAIRDADEAREAGEHEGLLRNFQVNDDGSVVDMHRYTITRAQYDAARTEGEA